MKADPHVVAALSPVAAVAMPFASKAEITELVDQLAPAYEIVAGQLRPGPDAQALRRANQLAPLVATAVACQAAGRASMSPNQRTLADLRARGIDPGSLYDDAPNGEDVFWDDVESRLGGGGDAA